MKVSDLLVKALENEGVRYVFALSGEENLDVLESLRTSSITTVVCRNEQAAGFMAATIGRLTGTPGVALATLGPGATNLITPAAYATLGAMPAVFITGQKAVTSGKQGAFQIVDVISLMRPVTKFTRQIIDGQLIAASVREAFRRAAEERPGCSHLELPEDIASRDTEATDLFSAAPVRRPIPEEKAIARAVDMIAHAKKPLLLVGAGANRKRTAKVLRALVEEKGIPTFSTQMGKGVVDERHPLSLGCAALSEGDSVHEAILEADLIINVGHDVVEKPPFIMHRGGPPVIHINFYPAQVDSIYFPTHEVIGDIGNALWQIKERLPHTRFDTEKFIHTKEKHGGRDRRAREFIEIIRHAISENGIVTLDNGLYKLWFARHYKTYEPNTLLLDNALATMGAGLPSAIAAKLIAPEHPVLCVAGDGGFMMNAQELETAVRLKLNLTILVLRDDSYGMIEWKQHADGFADFGLKFGNPDFVALAESHGVRGYRAHTPEEVGNLIRKTLGMSGLHLIEFPMRYDNFKDE